MNTISSNETFAVFVFISTIAVCCFLADIVWDIIRMRRAPPRKHPYPPTWKPAFVGKSIGMTREINDRGQMEFALELPPEGRYALVLHGHQVSYLHGEEMRTIFFSDSLDVVEFPRGVYLGYPDVVVTYPHGQPETLPGYQPEPRESEGS